MSNSASHLIAVLRLINFDVKDATRSDVERVVASINRNKGWTESTARGDPAQADTVREVWELRQVHAP